MTAIPAAAPRNADERLVKLAQLTIKCFASRRYETDVPDAMNATEMFDLYAERARAATCPTCRVVNMLGMMCAAAVDNGGFLAFVGQGHGGDWPDPRETAVSRRTEDSGSRC
ncbi:MAG TPA: hypothetical protein VFC56_03460 [Stellaceae bacterium]|nr:hypothetical protein [Stellaceae bacterium]